MKLLSLIPVLLTFAGSVHAQTNPYVLVEDFGGAASARWILTNAHIAPAGDCGNPSASLALSDGPGTCMFGAQPAGSTGYSAISVAGITFHPTQTMEYLFDFRDGLQHSWGVNCEIGTTTAAAWEGFIARFWGGSTDGADVWAFEQRTVFVSASQVASGVHGSNFKPWVHAWYDAFQPPQMSGGFNVDNLVVRPVGNGNAFCGGIACPCGNDAVRPNEGCFNSSLKSAWLHGYGDTSLVAGEIEFVAAQLPPVQPTLIFHGANALNGGNGIPFGDGLRCVGGSVQRLGTLISGTDGMATWTSVAASAGWTAGQTARLQVYYRDPITSPCGNGFNTTNGYELTLAP